MHKYIKDELLATEGNFGSKDVSQISASQSCGATHEDSLCDQKVIQTLGTMKFERRDNDRLDMIESAMEQFEVDIKSLKARTTIAIGLVSNGTTTDLQIIVIC